MAATASGKTCTGRCSYLYTLLLSSLYGIAGGYLCVTAILNFVALEGFGDSEAFLVGLLPLLLGLILSVSGVSGFVGIAKDSRAILLVDMCGTVLVAAILLAFLVILIAYALYIEKDDLKLVNSTSSLAIVEEVLNDYEIALFNDCCAAKDFGTEVGACSSQSRPCIANVQLYGGLSTYFVGPIICGALFSQDKISAATAANVTILEECGGVGGASQFILDVQESFMQNIAAIFSVTVLAVVLLCTLIYSITVLTCCAGTKGEDIESKEPEDREEGSASAFRQGLVSHEPETETQVETTRDDTEHERFTATWRPGALGPPPPVPPRGINTSSESFEGTQEF